MLLSAVSVLVVPQSSSEIPEGLMNNPVFTPSNSRLLSVLVIRFNGKVIQTPCVLFPIESSKT